MKKAALHNLGCKVNAYETEAMQQLLEEAGYEIVPFGDPADVYVVNTCSVTNIADRKSRQMLHRARRNNPGAVIVAAGCYVQAAGPDLLEEGIADIVLGNNKKEHLIPMLTQYMNTQMPAKDWESLNGQADYETLSISRTSQHTRAFMKIQDGCNQFCSYCIIPYMRGRVRSRQPQEVFKEAERLAQSGCKEIVLTGIHLSSYGRDHGDFAGDGLLELLKKLHDIEGIARIRLGSLEPGIITEPFAQALSAMDKICPHFHLSLQSGCDTVLRRMNRKYTAAEFQEKCAILRRSFLRPAITTDVIVGFPGETEEEFLQTEQFLRQIRFYEMHIFKYSMRKGTKAAAMDGQISDAQKTRRSARLIGLGKQMSREFRESFVSETADVLLEEEFVYDGKRYETGYTKEYVKIAVASEKNRANTIVRGKITGYLTQDIYLMVEF